MISLLQILPRAQKWHITIIPRLELAAWKRPARIFKMLKQSCKSQQTTHTEDGYHRFFALYNKVSSFGLFVLAKIAVLLGNCLCFLEKKGCNNKIPNVTKTLLFPLKKSSTIFPKKKNTTVFNITPSAILWIQWLTMYIYNVKLVPANSGSV